MAAQREMTSATSSSSAAATTGWSPRSIWPRPDTNRWCSNAARRSAGPRLPMNFIPDFAVRRWRTRRDRFCPDIVRDMQLEKHGLKLITPEVCVTALSPDGRALSLYQDATKSAQEIAAFSQKDAAKYPEFQQSLGKIGKSHWRSAGDHAARHRPSQPRRFVEHAEDRARDPQTGQERYVSPAALGADGGRRSGVGIF